MATLIHLSNFTEQHVDGIVSEWVEFAHAQQPPAQRLSNEELADHARVLLLAVAADVRSFQNAQDAHDKSRGDAQGPAPDVTLVGRHHAEQRFAQGFSLDHLVSEFRALRASVIRRWTQEVGHADRGTLGELTRFGEALDEALTASVSLYSAKVDEARNLLLGVLGHDLRTPIGVVSMTSNHLLTADSLSDAHSESIGRIHRSAERMAAMVRDILDFTGTALGVPLPVARSSGNIGDIAAHIVAEVRAAYPGCLVHFKSDGVLVGEWDSARIGQMLSNLIANAVQHGERGKGVDVLVLGEADQVTIRVHNDGPPIPAETRRTLFAPLRQSASAETERHTNSSGLGLGLYIAREIAVAHGGTIDVSSDNKGTAFSVRLPRMKAA